MTEVVGPNLTLPSTQAEESLDLDQAIRFGKYLPSEGQGKLVTDWKELNKIYKLQIDAKLLSNADTQSWHQRYEDIICTCVAMKLVAA